MFLYYNLRTPYSNEKNYSNSSLTSALNAAVADSIRRAEEDGNDLMAMSRMVVATVGGYKISVCNFAHYSEDSWAEQAQLFEVAIISPDGSILEDEVGDEAIFQIAFKDLAVVFDAVERANKPISRSGLWIALYRAESSFRKTKEEGIAAYTKAFLTPPRHEEPAKAETPKAEANRGPTTPEEVATWNKAQQLLLLGKKEKADALLRRLQLMIEQRLARS